MNAARERLARMIEEYQSGRDRSLHFVDQMEGLLYTEPEFLDTELYEELSTPLSCYRPGGGEGLYDEAMLAPILRWALGELRKPGELKRLETE